MVKQTIIPAIIPDSYSQLEDRLRELRNVVRTVQVDVMDGSFTPHSSWPYVGAQGEVFQRVRHEDQGLPFWQDFDLEIDLMVREPERHVQHWMLAGAARIIVHLDSTQALTEVIRTCAEARVEVAIALTPSSGVELLAPYVDAVTFVQCMGSDRIGSHGVPLDERAFEQIRAIKKRWPSVLVGVDIGVNLSTIRSLYDAGARRFAAGSAVFGGGDPVHAIQALEGALPDASY